jgi:hypothetical protein
MSDAHPDVGTVPFVTLAGMIGNEKPQATLEHYRLEQARLLTRGPVGTNVQVVFQNPNSATIRAVTLTAVDDDGQTFSLLNFAPQADFSDAVSDFAGRLWLYPHQDGA